MTDFDKIFASAPLNKTAATVTSHGEHYKPKCGANTNNHWSAPPKLRGIPQAARQNTSFVDYTGHRFGRLAVIGLLDDPGRSKKAPAAWVVRCTCGDYETRTAKAIRNPSNINDRCYLCNHTRSLREFHGQKRRTVEAFLADNGGAA